MPLKVAIVPDKFKGTLTAPEAAKAIAAGWRQVRPEDELELIPMSDGGDGFGETLALQESGERRRTRTVNAAGEAIGTTWWWLPESQTAVVETARVIGLAQLPTGKFHPFDLDTYGLGLVLKRVFSEGPKSCLIGLGGSATNDGGFGMARALGWRFFNAEGQVLDDWTELHQLDRIEPPPEFKQLPRIVVATDVDNRLLGVKGASRIYGPQKGLREEDMPQAEACLRGLAQALKKRLGRDDSRLPGAGAAGGLGFGCFAFLGGVAEPGFEVFGKRAQLDRRLAKVDLVLTGEGSIDRSSLMGKGVGRVAQWCLEHECPCIGLGGIVQRTAKLKRVFRGLYSMVGDVADEATAMNSSKRCLRQLARLAAEQLNLD